MKYSVRLASLSHAASWPEDVTEAIHAHPGGMVNITRNRLNAHGEAFGRGTWTHA
jgi:hypothetical protein